MERTYLALFLDALIIQESEFTLPILGISVIVLIFAIIFVLGIIWGTLKYKEIEILKPKSKIAFYIAAICMMLLILLVYDRSLVLSLVGVENTLAVYILWLVYVSSMLTFSLYLAIKHNSAIVKLSKGERGENLWIFKIDPANFRIFDWWRDNPDIRTEKWSYKHHKSQGFLSTLLYEYDVRDDIRRSVNAGDKVALWIEGDKAGIYAFGEVFSKPYDGYVDPSQVEYWKVPHPLKKDLMVEIRYLKKLFDRPLTQEFCRTLNVPRSAGKKGNILLMRSACEQINFSTWKRVVGSLDLSGLE